MLTFGQLLMVPMLLCEWSIDIAVFCIKFALNSTKFLLYYFPCYSLRGRSARDQGAMICECICSVAGRSLVSLDLTRTIQLKYGFQQSVVWAFVVAHKEELSRKVLYIEGVGPAQVYNPFRCLFSCVSVYDPNAYMALCQQIMGNTNDYRPQTDVLYVADDWLHHYPPSEIIRVVGEVIAVYKNAAFIINMSRVVLLRSNDEAAQLADDLEKLVGRYLSMTPLSKPVNGSPYQCHPSKALMAFVTF